MNSLSNVFLSSAVATTCCTASLLDDEKEPIQKVSTVEQVQEKQREFFLHYQGTGEVKSAEDNNHKILTLNTCMLDGDLPKKYGGMTRAEDRVEQLADFIRERNPDVFLGQELTLNSGQQLFEELRKDYPYFWVGMGVEPGVKQSGLFVASKYPIVDAKFVSFEGMQRVPDKDEIRHLERGFFVLETEKYLVATSHLEHSSPQRGGPFREQQLRYMTEKMDELSALKDKPYIVAGDLNIERIGQENDEYSRSSIPKLYYDYYTGLHPTFDDSTYTCTNLLTYRANGKEEPALDDLEERNEIDDYVLIRKGQEELFKNFDVRLIETYDLNKPPQEALTDHRAYEATFTL